ncbi:MAG: TetR/AcrR family transcriptional regulator [Pseudomonadota bacterium]
MADRPPPGAALRDACVVEALRVIASEGLEALSLRAVARRLGVSHQAPYKHFPSRDHLLAEAIRRCLQDFARDLRSAGEGLDAEAAMQGLGRAYLGYARARPLEYRLMFGTPWPEAARDLDLEEDARAAFDVLCDRLGAVRPDLSGAGLDREAMFVWSVMHGVAGVLESGSMRYLGMDAVEQDASVAHVMGVVDDVIRRG